MQQSNLFGQKVKSNIRLDCNLDNLQSFKAKNKNAHFEIITRANNHVLSPSWELVCQRKSMPFELYKKRFLKELEKRSGVLEKINEIRKLAKTKLVFLICYETDYNICHRSIIKELIEDESYGQTKTY